MDEKKYKEVGKTESEFTKEKKDAGLIANVLLLDFEDESDKRSADHILRQKNGLSEHQRNWFKILIGRKGKKFKL